MLVPEKCEYGFTRKRGRFLVLHLLDARYATNSRELLACRYGLTLVSWATGQLLLVIPLTLQYITRDGAVANLRCWLQLTQICKWIIREIRTLAPFRSPG